jgi:SAM-dependent methyltransferase
MVNQELRDIGKKNPFSGSDGRLLSKAGPVSSILRHLLHFGYYASIERFVESGSRVLDFGCGGGNGWLAKTYSVTGLDASAESVRSCLNVYPMAAVGDICSTEFPGQSFDAVVSKFVLEHLTDEAATEAFAEISRILRPGGCFLSLCDLECDHPQLAWLRRHYPVAYRRVYVLDPGHVGLRRAAEWRALIEAGGFEILDWNVVSRFPLLDHHPLGQFAKIEELPAAIRAVGRMAAKAGSFPPVAKSWGLATGTLDRCFRPFLPSRWGYRLLFAARKPAE